MSTTLSRAIPRLENGDELTREEFERRYDAMPKARAQLIEGVVYMSSPIRFDSHGRPHSRMGGLFASYEMATPGVAASITATVRLDDANAPEPDLTMVVLPEFGGQIQITEDYLDGPPELIAEISASTVSIDLHKKREAYERNGVKEYVVWRTEDGAIDWFVHDGQRFQRATPEADGVLRSRTFPGLWIDVPALLSDDGPKLLATLQRGLASAEHEAFVLRLREAAERIRNR